MGADTTRLQGTRFGSQSCLFQITTAGGTQLDWLEGVMGASYEDKRDRPKVYGSRRDGRPIGKLAGKYDPGISSMDMTEETYDLVTDTLAAESGDGASFGDVDFTMQIQLFEEDQVTVITKTFEVCNVVGEKGDYPTSGNDPLNIALAWDYLGKDTNGKTLYSGTRTPTT